MECVMQVVEGAVDGSVKGVRPPYVKGAAALCCQLQVACCLGQWGNGGSANHPSGRRASCDSYSLGGLFYLYAALVISSGVSTEGGILSGFSVRLVCCFLSVIRVSAGSGVCLWWLRPSLHAVILFCLACVQPLLFVLPGGAWFTCCRCVLVPCWGFWCCAVGAWSADAP